MAYEQMAAIYDEFMDNAPYADWVEFSQKVFAAFGNEVQRIADLGCGTGEITIRLAAKGFDLVGVDFSEDMLSLAEQKASEKRLPIQWLHQDLRELQGTLDLDAAVSYCDVMNYITSKKELSQVFQRVANSLKKGGLFLFDIHSLFHVKQHMINQTFADVTTDSAYIWFCSEGEEAGEMYHDITFFRREGSKYRRFDELHHQKTFSINTYKQLLQTAGFDVKKICGDFALENEKSVEKAARIFFVAEKRSR